MRHSRSRSIVSVLGSVTAVGSRVGLGLGVGLATTAALSVTDAASGQTIRAGGRRGLSAPEITTRSVERYSSLLTLDDAQKEAVKQLHQAYLDGTKKASEEMQEAMKAVQDDVADGDMSAFGEKFGKIMREQGTKRETLQSAFLADVRSLLTPKQEEAWPKLERLRRREGMGGGPGGEFVSGSGIDLTDLVNKLKLPEAEHAKVSDPLEQYEQDLDKLLLEKSKADEKLDGADGDKPFKMDFDMEKIKARMNAEREHAMKVRDLNRQYQKKIASGLSDDLRTKFDQEFKKRSYRQVFKPSYPGRLASAAMKFDDLTPDQRQTIQTAAESYDREVQALNDKWIQAQDKAEEEGKAGMMSFMGGGESEDLIAARKARRELDDKVADRIKVALNDKQREKLPKKRAAQDHVFAGGGSGGTFISTESISGDGEDGDEGGDGESSSHEVMIIRQGQ